MSNDRRISFDLPTTTPNTVIEVAIRYSKADHSYVDNRAEEQGFWVGMTPVTIEGVWRQFTAFSGLKAFDSPANRFSRKKLEAVRDKVHAQIMTGDPTDRYPAMLQVVIEKSGLVLQRTEDAEKAAAAVIE